MSKVLEFGKLAGRVVRVALTTVFSLAGYLVLMVASATVLPVAKAWHAGRLSAEHAAWHQQQAESQAFAEMMAGMGTEASDPDDRPVGLFL